MYHGPLSHIALLYCSSVLFWPNNKAVPGRVLLTSCSSIVNVVFHMLTIEGKLSVIRYAYSGETAKRPWGVYYTRLPGIHTFIHTDKNYTHLNHWWYVHSKSLSWLRQNQLTLSQPAPNQHSLQTVHFAPYSIILSSSSINFLTRYIHLLSFSIHVMLIIYVCILI